MSEIHLAEGTLYPQSVVRQAGAAYFLARLREDGSRRLGIVGDATGFRETTAVGRQTTLCPLASDNACALRARLPWLSPVPLGCKPSFGFGDRMGSATPGHVRALRTADPAGRLAPVFAQQSVRENARTGRTPQQVMDDAMWGVFQEGWRLPWGADADHIKERADLAAFIAAGYTFFTIDPGDQVDNAAQRDALDTLRKKCDALPWDTLQSTYTEMRARYCQKSFALEGFSLVFDETTLRRALAKYGRALAHVMTIAHDLTIHMAGKSYDLELSVDETDTPTSVHEHFFIAAEMRRCDVPLVSLAPRFVGKFQKGVDYIGDLAEFERELAQHAAVMRHFGGYKLSIHTGSDKFRIYPAIARHTRGLAHVKTAGTSYLEALRLVAAQDPLLFRRILDLARRRFDEDRKSYFLDARLNLAAESGELADADLVGLLEQFDARQILHVTFGSVLAEVGARIERLITRNETAYAAALESHFARHIAPFARENNEPE